MGAIIRSNFKGFLIFHDTKWSIFFVFDASIKKKNTWKYKYIRWKIIFKKQQKESNFRKISIKLWKILRKFCKNFANIFNELWNFFWENLWNIFMLFLRSYYT